MSFFKDIFGNNDSKDTEPSNLKWNDLTELQQLNAIVEESHTQPILIFKHSTRCSISRMALKNFERYYAINVEDAKPYYLDLLEHRDISNEIASRFGVVHQSPQLIIIKDGKAIYTASHSEIDADMVKDKIV